jgi:hypothetical protein
LVLDPLICDGFAVPLVIEFFIELKDDNGRTIRITEVRAPVVP